MKISNRTSLASALLLVVIASGCGPKKRQPLPPPPPPGSGGPSTSGNGNAINGAPVVTEFVVEPSSVERGQSAVLRWTVTNANSVSINTGIGTVASIGTRRVNPTDTTTYTLSASGPLGQISATATLTITSPLPPPPPPTNQNTRTETLERRIQSDLQDALFDYDSNNIRGDATAILTADAEALKRIFTDFPRATIIVEGHCDERGSAEYNLGLGDRRSTAARDYLTQLGVPADKLKTVSYGKERPACTEGTESCWQRNRRAHFSVGQ
jgi:peptidoglycan-associated lipoprotein